MGLFCGLWLHPEEMMGDRLAAILVAMLIVVTSLQSDLGLGKLSYLIWVDCMPTRSANHRLAG